MTKPVKQRAHGHVRQQALQLMYQRVQWQVGRQVGWQVYRQVVRQVRRPLQDHFLRVT